MRIPHLLTTILVARCVATHIPIALPRGAGPYRTSLVNEEWVDESRLDPYNQTHVRRIMISRFDPIVPADCPVLVQVPYMTNTTAVLEDEILATYEYPKGFRYYHESCDVSRSERPDVRKHEWPIAVLSGALNTTRFLSNYLAQEVSSHGFTVISMDHPYDTDIVEFPNGDVITGGHVQKPTNGSTASVEFALDVRARDASFVLDRLGVRQHECAVMFGNSFGGAAAATAMLHDKRLRAGVNIDGAMFGSVLNNSLGEPGRPQAFMLWGSSEHYTLDNVTWNQFWTALTHSPYVDYKKEFVIANSTHSTYWDLGVLADLAGIRQNLSETAKSLVGSLPGQRNWADIPGRYISAFFKHVLSLEPQDEILKGPSGEYPEVTLLRGTKN